MLKFFLLFFVLSFSLLGHTKQQKFPEAEIANGILKAHFYLPVLHKGYYQGTRFDWSGNLTKLEFDGHQFYGQWYEKYSPTIHDVVMGPSEEFGQIGYNETKVGGKFIKIGVGALLKPDDKPYSQFNPFKIANPGKWKTIIKSDQVQFSHELKEGEYGYKYTKTMFLVEGKAEMIIRHALKNTGKKSISTTVYNHNFNIIDGDLAGPDYVVKFPVNISAAGRGFGDIARIEGNKLIFLRKLEKSESLYCGSIEGLANDSKSYDFRVENIRTGYSIHITSSLSLLKLAFWSSSTTVCPEPFNQIIVEPGQEFKWDIKYEYYKRDNQSNSKY